MKQTELDGIAADLLHGLDSIMPDVAEDHQKIADALRRGEVDNALRLAEAYPNTIWWLKSVLTNMNDPT